VVGSIIVMNALFLKIIHVGEKKHGGGEGG
jgi:hypothetical protein